MFTGLVEDVGTLMSVESGDGVARFVIGPSTAPFELAVGDSVAVDGVCLTVTALDDASFAVTAIDETLRRTTLGHLRVGAAVNLERALRADARLGGHIMQGHVDGTGTLAKRSPSGDNLELRFAAPPALLRYIVEKGSIAISGVSLTVVSTGDDWFSVALIPHTAAATTLGRLEVSAPINLEVDIIAKYVEKLCGGRAAS